MEMQFKVPNISPKGKRQGREHFIIQKLGRMQSTSEETVLYENLIKTSYVQQAKENRFEGYFNKELIHMYIGGSFRNTQKYKKKRRFNGSKRRTSVRNRM